MMSDYDPQSIRSRALARIADFRLVVQKLKAMRSKDVDLLFYKLHQKVFAKIDCMLCANCCRGLGPRIMKSDMARISGALGFSVNDFMEKYIRVDDDNDFVFKTMPCPFLQENNLCSIYDVRPRACREYPHTGSVNMKSILSLCVKNTETCPAVTEIFEKLLMELRNH
jgi:uncharacterized protein